MRPASRHVGRAALARARQVRYEQLPVSPLFLGIAGGSGSGKSTIARAIFEAVPTGAAVMIEQDHYYRSQSDLSYEQREAVNYDHPDALEIELLCAHLDALRRGESIDRPTYDFAIHDRAPEPVHVPAAPVIVVEGILVLADERLRERLDVKIYVDTDPDIRLMRRIRRDLEHRGRSFPQVRKQYYETVRPMHLAFVEPSKRFADVIVPEGGENRVALELISSLVRARTSR
jgi:uridine kinase